MDAPQAAEATNLALAYAGAGLGLGLAVVGAGLGIGKLAAGVAELAPMPDWHAARVDTCQHGWAPNHQPACDREESWITVARGLLPKA